MTLSDYLTDSILILIVLRQVRESRYDRRAIILPLAIVAFVAHSYLHSLPTAGNDLVLITALTAIGLALGVTSALATRVRADGQPHALVKAGVISAGLWVASMGFRMAFAIWAATASGRAHLTTISVDHRLTGEVWTTALVLMALAEVISRVGVLYLRSRRAVAAFDAAPNALDRARAAA